MFLPGQQEPIKKDNINEELETIKGYIPERQAQELVMRYFRANIRMQVELMTGIKLFPFQEMLIKIMMNRDNVMLVLSRGMSKTFTAAVFVFLHAIFEPGAKIAVLSKTFRQSRMILMNIEEFIENKRQGLLRECIQKPSQHKNDEWSIHIGKQVIRALPLGSGDKIRGFRFTLVVIDEFLLMPEKIVNEVIMPFLATNKDPKKRQETMRTEDELIAKGLMTEEERTKFKNPKMVALQSAQYKFEFLYKKYCDYITNIENGYEIDQDTGKKKQLQGTYAVVQLAYDSAPEALYNKSLIEAAKKEMSAAQFRREFGSQFTDDSGGFFSARSILACSINDGEDDVLELYGDPHQEYVLAVDPSWAENDTSDHFAMCVAKLDPDGISYKPVHFYAVAGGKLKDHIQYLAYILENFNIVFTIVDNAGGVTFLNAANESELFKNKKLQVKTISNEEVKLSDKNADEWDFYIEEARKMYDPSNNVTAYAQFFSSEWIRKINERVQQDIDNKRILFPARVEANITKFDYVRSELMKKNISSIKVFDADDDCQAVLNYENMEGDQDGEQEEKVDKSPKSEKNKVAKVIDMIERQDELLELCKRQMITIEARQTENGQIRFDIPRELKAIKGANRPRKDLYSTILLAQWAVRVYSQLKQAPAKEKYKNDWVPVQFQGQE